MAAAEEDRIEEGNWDALKKVVRSLRMLYVAVVLAKARGETRMFEHTFRYLENTLDKFKSCKPFTPFAEESVIDLQFSNEELENLRAQLETGLELVEKCSKVHWWAIFKWFDYARKLDAVYRFLFDTMLNKLREWNERTRMERRGI
ncbi:hypothetical protein C1H46_028170 [Malus baccata]|uniref:RPW8 domain-containing protein n=1 Tax=Malus baccata TaxID=106549 RepID=A0A540LII2_MALBA|nr:hypothetical protein C1H46_028170 [Malus baccata]